MLWFLTPWRGGGVHDLRMDWKLMPFVCRPVFRELPSSNYRQLPSYPILWWILAEKYPFLTIFSQFLEKPPMFKENVPKKRPLFTEFWTQKPTNMGGTYPYTRHAMLSPPPGFLSNVIGSCQWLLAILQQIRILGLCRKPCGKEISALCSTTHTEVSSQLRQEDQLVRLFANEQNWSYFWFGIS